MTKPKIKKITKLNFNNAMRLLEEYEQYFDEAEKINKTGHTHYKTKEVEEKLLKMIEDDENVLIVQDRFGQNIGMRSAELRLENVTLRALDNFYASIQQNKAGKNIGMLSAKHLLIDASLKALNNKVASVQKDYHGFNIGMWGVEQLLEPVVLKAMDNREACNQEDKHGYTIVSASIRAELDEAVNKAFENKMVKSSDILILGTDASDVIIARYFEQEDMTVFME